MSAFAFCGRIADIPFSLLSGHYMLLLVRIKRLGIYPDKAPEAFASDCQWCHGRVGCAHVNSPLGFTQGRDEEKESSTFKSLRHLPGFA